LRAFKFEELSAAPLIVDAIYEGGEAKNLKAEVLAKVFSAVDKSRQVIRVQNVGGFRYRGSLPKPRLVVLTSNSSETAWPDSIDPFTGQLTYFGDNRSPGELHAIPRGGNRILREAFLKFDESSVEREKLPVFFYFSKWKGFSQQFRGLAVPGGVGVKTDERLTAIWRTKDGARFQNYRALFTILNVGEVPRNWIDDLLLGRDKLLNAPAPYASWVRSGRYDALISESVVQVRSKDEQLPNEDSLSWKLVDHIHKRFGGKDAYDFEAVALALWRLQSGIPVDASLTRRSVDGGRDAFGVVRIGPDGDPLKLDFALEAKCYGRTNSVGVKETSRLISRLRRHHFGVLVTTSYVAAQAYKELRDDSHPVVLMAAVDIAHILLTNGMDDITKLDKWLDSIIA
jgi:hypothetical protein